MFQLMPTWLNDGREHFGGGEGLSELKELAEDLAEPWRSSILWIPDGTEISPNSVSYWITSPWDNQGGTVTLAGDAAHPLPPRELPIIFANVANISRSRARPKSLYCRCGELRPGNY